MIICHFVCIPFTGHGKPGYRGDKWLKNRIRIFKTFTLAALLNQTKKEFILVLNFRPQEKENPLVKDLEKCLAGIRGLTAVFTFHGTLLYDDKYEDKRARKRLLRSLRFTLRELEGFIGTAEWVFLTCQPSDDLYIQNAIELIQDQVPEHGKAVGWIKGYILNCATKEIADYDPSTLPPFTTVIFPKEIFLNAEKHMAYIGPYKSHEYIKDHLKYVELAGRGYMVGTHGENISTAWNIPYKGREILGNEREAIWLNFGIWDADPVIVHRKLRLWGRKIFNHMPRIVQKIFKNIYHKARNAYYGLE